MVSEGYSDPIPLKCWDCGCEVTVTRGGGNSTKATAICKDGCGWSKALDLTPRHMKRKEMIKSAFNPGKV